MEEARVNEQAQDFVRQEKILKLISTELTKNTTRVVEAAVRSEVQNSVLPSLENITKTEVKMAVNNHLSKGLSDSMSKVSTLPSLFLKHGLSASALIDTGSRVGEDADQTRGCEPDLTQSGQCCLALRGAQRQGCYHEDVDPRISSPIFGDASGSVPRNSVRDIQPQEGGDCMADGCTSWPRGEIDYNTEKHRSDNVHSH